MRKEVQKPKRAADEKTREGVSQDFIDKIISLQKTTPQSK